MKVFYQDDHFLLFQGDALDYLDGPHAGFDAILTDPPFDNLPALIPTVLKSSARVTLTPAITHTRHYPLPDRQGTLFYLMNGIHVHRPVFQYGPAPALAMPRTLTAFFADAEPERIFPFPWDQTLPLVAARHLIRATARPGETLVDPFLGSGTFAIAAREYGCRLVATELDEVFCETAVARYLAAFPDRLGAQGELWPEPSQKNFT